MLVNGRQQVGIILAHLVVVVVGFISATVLTYSGKLDSGAYTAIIGTLIGLVGGGAISGAGAAAGAAQPHAADAVIAAAAAPVAGGRRAYDPPAQAGGAGPEGRPAE